ncbi:MAG: DNA repair protein RecO [Candidatus Cyclobacteriaceae bacterium M3_2C_046]
MLYKTRSIVLNYIKFRDTSIISRIYTEQLGLRSYIVNGVRSARSKNKIALFQPLTLLDLVVYEKPQANINRISELRCQEPFREIPINIRKSSIALFLAEVLNKSLKEETENQDLFQFIHHSMLILDQQSRHFENFHLQFLLKISRFFGFAPSSGLELISQVKTQFPSLGLESETDIIDALLAHPYHDPVNCSNSTRRRLLDLMIQYYQLHLESMGEIKSLAVLKEVMQ